MSSEDYEKLYSKIKAYGTWAHILESTWAVVTSKSSGEVFDDLKQYLDGNDGLLVLKTAGVANWKNVLCKDSWLKDNL